MDEILKGLLAVAAMGVMLYFIVLEYIKNPPKLPQVPTADEMREGLKNGTMAVGAILALVVGFVLIVALVSSINSTNDARAKFIEYCHQHEGVYLVQPSSNPDGDACINQRN